MIDGIMLVDKEKDMTSRDVVNIVSKQLKTKKVGHLGTLDPLATGLMVLTIGKATKLAPLLEQDDKEYIAEVQIGHQTDTYDITGNTIMCSDIKYTKEQIVSALNHFEGTYEQEVPKYSAVKINGKKLYEYARNNEEIELPKRKVNIYKIKLQEFKNDSFTFQTKVSKGTYIRALINDIGIYLHGAMTMSNLRRIKSGQFDIKNSNSIEEIKKNKYKIIPMNEVLSKYKQIEVDSEYEFKVINGQILNGNEITVYTKGEKVLGIYKPIGDNKIKPMHIFK